MDFPDLDDVLNSSMTGTGGGGGRRGKTPKVKVPWSLGHYLAAAVAAFALVCIVYAVVSEFAFSS